MNRGVWASLVLAGCAAVPSADPSPTVALDKAPPLYERLGGEAAVGAVVDDFMGRVARDERINAKFINSDLPRLRGQLVAFICQATGGPCKYTGKDMRTAHVGMKISGAEFDALVEDLKGALDHLKVPAAEQNELLSALGPLKPEIVEAQPPAPPPGSPSVRKAVSRTGPGPARRGHPAGEGGGGARQRRPLFRRAAVQRGRGRHRTRARWAT